MNRTLTLILSLAFTTIACGGSTPEPQSPSTPTDVASPPANSDATDEQQSDWGDGIVTGIVRLADNAKPLAEGFKLQLRIDEGGPAGGSKTIGKIDNPLQGPAPYAFEIKADNSSSAATSIFLVNGFIAGPDGLFWYGAKEPIRIFTKGEPRKPIDIVMIPLNPQATKK